MLFLCNRQAKGPFLSDLTTTNQPYIIKHDETLTDSIRPTEPDYSSGRENGLVLTKQRLYIQHNTYTTVYTFN